MRSDLKSYHGKNNISKKSLIAHTVISTFIILICLPTKIIQRSLTHNLYCRDLHSTIDAVCFFVEFYMTLIYCRMHYLQSL